MGVGALGAGVELEVPAAALCGFAEQPDSHRSAVAARSDGGVGDEIVDVENATRRERFQLAKTGDRADRRIEESGEHVAAGCQATHVGDEALRGEVWPELNQ